MSLRPVFLLFTLIPLAIAQTDNIQVGLPGDPVTINTAPSVVFGYPGVGVSKVVYKQLYASSNFPGAVTLSGVQFFSGSGTLTPANYIISLATVSTALGAFPIPDPSVSQVLFSGYADSTNNFVFMGTPYTYDPALGNLLVTITGQNYGSPSVARMIGRTTSTGGSGLFSNFYTQYNSSGGSGSIGQNGGGMSTQFYGVLGTGTSPTGTIQLICRPLDPGTGILGPYIPLVGRHCYFLTTDISGQKNTYGAYEVPSVFGFLTPLKNADLVLGQPKIPGGCTGGVLGSDCVNIPIPSNQTYQNLVGNLEQAVNVGPLLFYNNTSNNCNTWAEAIISQLGLSVTMPPHIIASQGDLCAQYSYFVSVLANNGVRFGAQVILDVYGAVGCI